MVVKGGPDNIITTKPNKKGGCIYIESVTDILTWFRHSVSSYVYGDGAIYYRLKTCKQIVYMCVDIDIQDCGITPH